MLTVFSSEKFGEIGAYPADEFGRIGASVGEMGKKAANISCRECFSALFFFQLIFYISKLKMLQNLELNMSKKPSKNVLEITST